MDALVPFLGNGLAIPRRYLAAVMRQLGWRETLAGFPQYGLLLESAGEIVGAILMIFSENYADGAKTIRSAHLLSPA